MVRVIKQKSLSQKISVNLHNFKLFGFIGIMTLVAGLTFYLTTQQQDIRQQASGLSSSEFGFNTHLNAAGGTGYWENLTIDQFKATVDDISARGQKWIRINIAPWESATSVSPTGISWNEANLQKYDEAISYARKKGLKVYLATALPDSAKDFSFEDYKKTSKIYHSALAQRYKDQIEVWQAWNEADAHRFRDYSAIPFGEENNPQYANEFKDLLGVTKNSIKGIDPKVLFTTNIGRYPVNEEMFTNLNSFLDVIEPMLDVIAVDLYMDGNFNNVSSNIDAIKSKYNKPVIIAETGIPTNDGRFTEEQQAEYLSGAINELKLANPMAIIVYQYWDTLPDTDKTESSFGVVNKDGLRKASYSKVMEAMTPVIPTPTGLLRVETNPAAQATLTVTSIETGEIAYVSEWGVDWKSLPIGNYLLKVEYTLSSTINGQPVKIPQETPITIFKGQTTTAVVNIQSGTITVTPTPAVTPTSTPVPPTNTPVPTSTPIPTVAVSTGLLRVETQPAANIKFRVINTTTRRLVLERSWGVDWESLPPGNYSLSYTFRSGRRASSKNVRFTIQKGKTTQITVNSRTGSATVKYL